MGVRDLRNMMAQAGFGCRSVRQQNAPLDMSPPPRSHKKLRI